MLSFSVSNWKFRLVVVIVAMLLLWQTARLVPWLLTAQLVSTAAFSGRPIWVTVFYEGLCSDSHELFVKQVLPVAKAFTDSITIDLIPYGKAETVIDKDGQLNFICQHGPKECLANKIHGCAIHLLSDSVLVVQYATCLLSDFADPQSTARTCAQSLLIDPEPILACANSAKGDTLLDKFRIKTNPWSDKLTFIPTVLVDNMALSKEYAYKWLKWSICNRAKNIQQSMPACGT